MILLEKEREICYTCRAVRPIRAVVQVVVHLCRLAGGNDTHGLPHFCFSQGYYSRLSPTWQEVFSIGVPNGGLTKRYGAAIIKTASGELRFPRGRAVPVDGCPLCYFKKK